MCLQNFPLHPWQDFYTEQLEGDFRSTRFIDLARKEGVPVGKVERQLETGKASHLASHQYQNYII